MDRLLSLFEALRAVLATARPLEGVETVDLDASLGRRLAEDVHADGPWPATDRSAMDGFAVVAGKDGLASGVSLPVVGESLAGKPFARALRQGEAIRIMTGGVVPAGADSVVPVEATSGYATTSVTLLEGARPGANVRPRGSEVAPGTLLVPCGARIRAAEIGALAVLGRVRVAVQVAPTVAILSTGDEVVPLEVAPAPHQVRDSNARALAAQVRLAGAAAHQLGIAKDEPADLEARLLRGLRSADVLLTIGGISEGTHDLVHDRLLAHGVQKHFHGIALKPGKPTFFGVHDDGTRRRYVFGLPGNPASCFTVFDLLVRPLLAALQGDDPAWVGAQAVLAGAGFKANRRLQAIPAQVRRDPDGRLRAELAAVKTSGDPFSLVPANGYALIPPDVPPNAVSEVQVVLQGGAGFPR